LKKSIKILIIVIVIGLVGAYGIGNYFVEYVLGRKPIDFTDKLSPKHSVSIAEVEGRVNAAARINALYENVEFKEVRIPSEKNEQMLYAKMFLQEDSHLWAIIVHGYNSRHQEVEDIATKYYDWGYNVILPDLRAHGNSTGEYVTLGQSDKRDIIRWINYIDQPEAEIVLHGVSMGAATVMLAAGEDDLSDRVVAVVEDSGYTTALQMMKEQLKYRFNLPSFPIIGFSNMVSVLKTGLNLYAPKPIKALEKADLPILFIHGDADIFILPYMQKELYEAYDGEKEMLVIKDAGHVVGRYMDEELYYKTVYDFLNKYVEGMKSQGAEIEVIASIF